MKTIVMPGMSRCLILPCLSVSLPLSTSTLRISPSVMSDAATAATAARAVFTPSIVDCAWAVDARATNPGRGDRGAELVEVLKIGRPGQ